MISIPNSTAKPRFPLGSSASMGYSAYIAAAYRVPLSSHVGETDM